MRLARLPAGTVQVLGAEKAFFNHLKTGAPPPKHGHIFMHPWISRSPRWVRGKIARTIAARASIAAKIDAFEGEAWGETEMRALDDKVEAIKAAHPRPPSRRN
jgi:nucleolar protein 56